MPLNYQNLVPQIKSYIAYSRQYHQQWQVLRQTCLETLENFPNPQGGIEQLLQQLTQTQSKYIRCAKPISEPINASFDQPFLDLNPTILAADGSQILPDRHAAFYFGLINVSGFALPYGENIKPQIFQQSQLLFGESLENLNESRLALKRDLLEREMILQLGKLYSPWRIGLIDGPIELWWGNNPGAEDLEQYQDNLNEYFGILDEIHQEKVIFAGYIDRPESNYLVRLLEIGLANQRGIEDLKGFHPFQGVADIDILQEILKPAQRSAVFELQSPMNQKYPEHSRICFFYVNVGSQNQPWLGRIEIPAWVGADAQLTHLVHAAVAEQCQIMGNHAYPYALHRAHELAVVTQEEKEEIMHWVTLEMQRGGLPICYASHKQRLKNLPSRQIQKIKQGGRL